MNTSPIFKISAVIPTYNRAQCLRRAIESVLAQEYAPSEIIVIDDGSTDGTRDLIKSYGDKIRYIYQPNAGVSSARDHGIREASGDWIAFLDSDDYWTPQHFNRLVRAMDATSGEAAIYFSDLRLAGEEFGGHYWGFCRFEIRGDWEFKRRAGDWALLRIQPIMLQASVISRKAYFEVGGFPIQLRTREDTFLFYKLALSYPACAVAGCGTVMNSDGNGRLTQVYNHESLVYCDASIFMYRELWSRMRDLNPEYRRHLRDSLAASHFGVGRVHFRRRDYWKTVVSLGMSCRVSPLIFMRELVGSLSRKCFERADHEQASPLNVGASV